MYRPGRISHQKSISVSEGFGCGKFEFARPICFLTLPAGQIRQSGITCTTGKVPGNLTQRIMSLPVQTTAQPHGIKFVICGHLRGFISKATQVQFPEISRPSGLSALV